MRGFRAPTAKTPGSGQPVVMAMSLRWPLAKTLRTSAAGPTRRQWERQSRFRTGRKAARTKPLQPSPFSGRSLGSAGAICDAGSLGRRDIANSELRRSPPSRNAFAREGGTNISTSGELDRDGQHPLTEKKPYVGIHQVTLRPSGRRTALAPGPRLPTAPAGSRRRASRTDARPARS